MLSMLTRMVDWIGVRANWCLAASMFIGLVAPPLAAAARPMLPIAIGILLVVALLRVDPVQFAATIRQRRMTLALVWFTQMILAPLGLFGVLMAVSAWDWMPPALPVAMLMGACTASLIGTTSMAAIARLDSALALGAVLTMTVTVPVLTPWMTGLLTGLSLEIDMLAFAGRLALLILGSLAAAAALRWLIPQARIAAAVPGLDGLFVLAMAAAALGMMEGLGDYMTEQPGRAALFTGASFALNLVLQVLAVGLFAGLAAVTRPLLAVDRLNRRGLLTVGLLGGFRNLAFLIAALPTGADREIVMFFAIAQFPIHMMPLLTQAVYGRLLKSAEGPTR